MNEVFRVHFFGEPQKAGHFLAEVRDMCTLRWPLKSRVVERPDLEAVVVRYALNPPADVMQGHSKMQMTACPVPFASVRCMIYDVQRKSCRSLLNAVDRPILWVDNTTGAMLASNRQHAGRTHKVRSLLGDSMGYFGSGRGPISTCRNAVH